MDVTETNHHLMMRHLVGDDCPVCKEMARLNVPFSRIVKYEGPLKYKLTVRQGKLDTLFPFDGVSVTGSSKIEQAFTQPETSALGIMQAAYATLNQRAKDYDQPAGERSIPRTVAIFNAATGLSLTPEQGWVFMIALKLARSLTKSKLDTALDLTAYAALYGEQQLHDDLHEFKQTIQGT